MQEKLIQRLYNRFINESATAKLADNFVIRELFSCLTDKDVEEIENNDIFFNPMFSPSSTSQPTKNISISSHLISIDVNSSGVFSGREMASIILHEIGHANNSNVKGMEGEFIADQYAIDHGFKNDILSALNKGIENFPNLYKNSSTLDRIQNIEKK